MECSLFSGDVTQLEAFHMPYASAALLVSAITGTVLRCNYTSYL